MNRALQRQLAEAAYNARRTALATGIYHNHDMSTPHSSYVPDWTQAGVSVQEIYCKEAEAVVSALLAPIYPALQKTYIAALQKHPDLEETLTPVLVFIMTQLLSEQEQEQVEMESESHD